MTCTKDVDKNLYFNKPGSEKDLTVSNPTCPSSGSCLNSKHIVTFELSFVGVTKATFDEKKYKVGVAAFLNTGLPTNVFTEALVEVKIIEKPDRRVRRMLLASSITVETSVSVPNKQYSPASESGNTANLLSLKGIISTKVTNLKVNSDGLVDKLKEQGLPVESITLTKDLSTTFEEGIDTSDEVVSTNKEEGLSWVQILLILIGVCVVVMSIFMIYRNERKKCSIRAAERAAERAALEKKKFSKMKMQKNPLRRQSQVNSFLENTGGSLVVDEKLTVEMIKVKGGKPDYDVNDPTVLKLRSSLTKNGKNRVLI